MSEPKQPNSFPLRMPAPLRARLESRAKENGRSTNSEIVAMLTALLDAKSPDLATIPAPVLLDEVISRYDARVQIMISQDSAEKAGIASPSKKSK